MDYTINQVAYPSNNSLLSLFVAQAMPYALELNNTRSGIPNLMITNSGSQRFDLYSGPFTKNDQLTSSPFADSFLYIPNVTYSVASQVAPYMNNEGSNNRRDLGSEAEREEELYKKGYVGKRFRRWLEDMDRRAREDSVDKRDQTANATLGYVTTDSCPGAGDDTAHEPLSFHDIPDFIVSDPPANVKDTDTIDLVFVDFIQAQLLATLNTLQSVQNYTATDVSPYSELLSNAVLGVFAQSAWN